MGADHGGLQMKDELVEYLQEKNIRVEDMGAYELNPTDDYPDYANQVAQGVLQNLEHNRGIVACRSGVGADITANRHKKIRSVLGFNETQVRKAREDDDVNILSLPADYISIEEAKKLVDIFLSATAKSDSKYKRRIEKMDA